MVKQEEVSPEVQVISENGQELSGDWKVSELVSLIRVWRQLGSILETPRLIRAISSSIREKYGTQTLALFLYDKSTRTFELAHQYGLRVEEFTFLVDSKRIQNAVSKKKPFAVVDATGKMRYESFFQKHGLKSLKSVLWAPLVVNKEVLGLITIGRRAGKSPYTAYDVAFLSQIGGFSAICLRTCMMYESQIDEKMELDKTLKDLSMLFNIGRAMNMIQDLKNLLGYILRQAIEITAAQKGSIMLYDAATDRLRIRVIEGMEDEQLQERINNQEVQTKSFKPGEGIAGQVFEKGEPIFLNNIKADPRFAKGQKTFATSIACIPMIVYGDGIGVINVTNKKDGKGFSKYDLDLLKAVADQAAVAVNKAQLWEMAVTDSLTGLSIRRFFIAKVNEEIRRSERLGKPFSIIMTDLDKFKNINDKYGHSAGDLVLKSVGGYLGKKISGADQVARFGGEEFVILLAESNKEAAYRRADALRKEVSVLRVGKLPAVTVSMGVASYPEDGKDVDGLLKKSDEAMYRAKQSGRNKVEVYREDPGSLIESVTSFLRKRPG